MAHLPNSKEAYLKFMRECYGTDHTHSYIPGQWDLATIEHFSTLLKKCLHKQHLDEKDMPHIMKMLNQVHHFRQKEHDEIKRLREEAEARLRAEAEAKKHAGGHKHQDGWRWCSKCSNLWFSGNGAGVCAKGGGHDASGSYKYKLPHGGPNPKGGSQGQWRWCRKTQGMAFSGNGQHKCPGGGHHDHTGSFDYHLNHGKGHAGQNQWRWCCKCQELFHGELGTNIKKTKCPVTGGNHDPTGSHDYVLAYDP